MNRRLILTGILLWSTSLPDVALANVGDMDFSCTPLEGKEAVSEYARKVLDRADKGISYAQTAGSAGSFLSILPGWALSMTSAWAGLTDTTSQRSDTIQELNSVSACLHFDLTLIDCKIEKVRQELHAQTSRGSFIAIIRLLSLLQFLNDRKQQLTIGALDPQYPDPTWGNRYSFDKPDTIWCTPERPDGLCVQITEGVCTARRGTPYQTQVSCEARTVPDDSTGDKGRLCPFDMNYAPAFDNGFGCDIDIMEPRKVYPPVNAELEGLRALSGSLAAYRKTAEEVMELQRRMDSLFGTTPTVPPTPPTREHLNAFGCGWMGGWCSDDPKKRCTSKADCKDMKATCDFSDKVCKQNRAIRCTDGTQCAGNGPCIDAAEPAMRSLRGNFSLDRDQMTILEEFLNVRSQQEISRVLRSDLQTAAEIPASDPDLREKRAREDNDPALFLWRSSLRLAVRTWSRLQARGESLMYPEAVDAPLESAHALEDLHKSVNEIARLASEKEGLRDFVIRYAWFLRRSCIYRSCSLLLDQAIRLGTTDECFPYTNGEYLDDDEDNPRWEKCKEAAGIE